MFNVEYLYQNIEAIRPILSGVTFGFFENPIFFKINATEITSDLLVSFTVKRKKIEIANFNTGKIENNKLNIEYSVPETFTNSGFTNPTSILVVNDKILAIMFQIININNSSYKFEYEFYEGTVSSQEKKNDARLEWI